MPQTIILLAAPSSFSQQLEAILLQLGYQTVVADSQSTITQAMVKAPILTLVDLSTTSFDWARLVRYIKGPAKKNNHMPVIGFDDNLSTTLEETARTAGCTALVTRLIIIEQTQSVIDKYRWQLDEEICALPLPILARQGIREFNEGLYFECHETLEDVWNDHEGLIRVFYQGILQIAVGYLHIRRKNWRGAVKVLERGIPKIAHFRPICQGVDVADLVEQAQAIRTRLIDLGPDRIAEFEAKPLPTVKLIDKHL